MLESSEFVEQLAGTGDRKLFTDESSDADLPCGWIITLFFWLWQNFWSCNTNCMETIPNEQEINVEEFDRRKLQNGVVIAQHMGIVGIIKQNDKHVTMLSTYHTAVCSW
jgi:hypothetical protein